MLPIDVQRGFEDPTYGERNNPHAEDRIADLLEAWREADRPVFHIHHHSTEPDSPLRPDTGDVRPKAEAEPRAGEPVLIKQVNCAFVGTDLAARLRAAGSGRVVLVGLTTDHCVSTTARLAENYGFDVVVVSDATATFERELDGQRFDAETVHRTALLHLAGEFATVVSAERVLAAI